MRRTIILTCVMLLFTVSALAAGPKIGIVNMQKIIAKSEPGQNAMKTLQEEFKDDKARMEKQKQAIQTLRQQLQKQNLVLSQDAKEDKELAYKRKVRDFQDMYRSLERRIKQSEKKLSQPVIQLIVEVITKHGKKNGYTAITDAQASGLIYADEKADLTDTIMVEVNRTWRAKNKEQGTK
ncbi:OmpH/Skp family outer membrane protein [Desulfoplanes sp.]